MNKKQIKIEIDNLNKQISEEENNIVAFINGFPILSEEWKNKMISAVLNMKKQISKDSDEESYFHFSQHNPYDVIVDILFDFASTLHNPELYEIVYDYYHQYYHSLGWEKADRLTFLICEKVRFEKGTYSDMEAFFDGDIMITDPGYVVSEEHLLCSYINDTYSLALPHKSLVNSTFCGDWECSVLNEKNDKIGSFGADSGLVAVMNVDDVIREMKSNEEAISKGYGYIGTIIRNFRGTVKFIIKRVENKDYFELSVLGNGFDSVTGDKIIFHSVQTGF